MPVHAERFTRAHPCPICGGWDQQPRDRGIRCYGYLDSTGEYARCTRKEQAGQLERNSDETYSHRLQGFCRCGQEHGLGEPRVSPNGAHGANGKQQTTRHLEQRYEIRDVAGTVIAIHERYVDELGEKSFSWRRPGFPSAGLHGLKANELPLYGSEHLGSRWQKDSIVLVEGEKAAQRLQELNIPALGTVTGAGKPQSPKRPSDAVLACLEGYRPILWPDNDEEGRAGHMEPIAEALSELGIEVRWVEWPEAPAKADAADFLVDHDYEQTVVLLRTAQPWRPQRESAEATVIPSEQTKLWPTPPAEEAYHGLVARMVGFISPYVESDEPSVLAQFLTAFGIACGLEPHFRVGATRHAPTTFLGLVGRTSRARKGTSWDPIRTLFRGADPAFSQRVMSGLGSGERLVWLVRDPSYDSEGKLIDAGAGDRRLLLQEPELARLLTIVNREGSTLSAYLRAAYDGQALRNEVKSNGSIASSHHIGLIGHCTVEDLTGQLKEQEIRNGLANRVLWVLARRDKKLPDPPSFEGPAVEEAVSELSSVLARARQVGRLSRHAAAQRLWNEWYLSLPDDESGVLGAVTNRAEAQVVRFSMIYALTDGSEVIGVDHLRAAIALWDYSTRCAGHIFGGSTGHLAADKILEALAIGPLLKTEIHDLFNRNLPAQTLLEAQRLLERRSLLVREMVATERGRPPERWRLR